MNISFLGILSILEEMFSKELLLKDPNNSDNMLVYMEADASNPEGWYSENIHSVAREILADVESQDAILTYAKENGIDVEDHFTSADNFLSSMLKVLD